MAFDSMAAAIDWLDAYRSHDLDAVLGMFADNAVIECNCGQSKRIAGEAGLRAYWTERFGNNPASELDDLQPYQGGAAISYIASTGIVSAVLIFDANAKIAFLRCGAVSNL
jgi:ketosteroid isomerase-like protein